jgi:hypothetical protein
MLKVEVWILAVVPEKVRLAGVKEHEILTDAALEQVRSTVPVKPLIPVTLTVEVPAWPAAADVTNPSNAKSWVGVTAVHAEMRLATSSEPRPVT